MPTSSGNPYPLLPIDIPKTPGGLPASGPPMTGFTGIRVNYPIQKLFLSGAVRRDMDGITFGAGGSLSASTAYAGWFVIPRNSLITAIYLTLQTVPTVANASLTVTYNSLTLLSAASYAVATTFTAGVTYSLPLATTGALIDSKSGLPYVTTTNGPSSGAGVGFPYPILATYTEGASTVHSSNVVLNIEFEPDDFNG